VRWQLRLQPPRLLGLLLRRYMRDAIYTFTGDILISINPYKAIRGLYDLPESEYGDRKVPHVFGVAEQSYRTMLEETNPSRKNQSMIVSGESGAGKTENCKHVMRYLTTLSARYVERNRALIDSGALGGAGAGGGAGGASSPLAIKSPSGAAARAENGSTSPTLSPLSPNARAQQDARDNPIEKKVLDCNPFLEAFGNAKTVRNDNSSRFGKFLKIEYEGGRILGARIRHYLLEKARVVWPNEGERNYHVFYQLARGVTPAERKTLELGPVEEFHYLTCGGMPATFVDGVDDAAEFADVLLERGEELREPRAELDLGAELAETGVGQALHVAGLHVTEQVVEVDGVLGRTDAFAGVKLRQLVGFLPETLLVDPEGLEERGLHVAWAEGLVEVPHTGEDVGATERGFLGLHEVRKRDEGRACGGEPTALH
jgi:hypothetical protein